MKPGSELSDIVIGKADAPVTIIEYASMTCPHCAHFHNTIYPQLKEKYLDTGKAKLIFREFPLDDTALAASMLARCVGGAGPAAMISDLFKRQEQWAFVPKNVVVARLFDMARQAGFTKASFDKCLTDDKLLNQITAIRKRANDAFGVNSTPTFFINGTRNRGGSMADFERAIDPLLKGN
jgi:protein-disulfide isomerase